MQFSFKERCLSGTVNSENFGEPGLADYRNPHLADAMKVLGFVQRFGVGIQTAQRELAENGNPSIQFKVDQNWVRSIIKAVLVNSATANGTVNGTVNCTVNDIQKKILSQINENKKITLDELAEKLKKGRRTIIRHVQNLKEQGVLLRIGSDKTGHWEITDPKPAK